MEGLKLRLPVPSPPTQARGFEKRDRIYQAAMERFRVDGVAATKVDDVIADADVSWGTFFRYFPRKGDVLIEAAVRHFHDHVRPSAEASLADHRLKISTVIQRLLVSSAKACRPAGHPSRGGVARDLLQPGQVRRPGRRETCPAGHRLAREGARRGSEAWRDSARSRHGGRRLDHDRRAALIGAQARHSGWIPPNRQRLRWRSVGEESPLPSRSSDSRRSMNRRSTGLVASSSARA